MTSTVKDNSTDPVKIDPYTANLFYNSTIAAGFIPILTVQDKIVTSDEARQMLFNGKTLKDDNDILKQFATVTDNNADSSKLHGQNTLHFGVGYNKNTAFSYNGFKDGQTYDIPIYAENDAGSTNTQTAKLTIKDPTPELKNIAAEFVDVDGKTSFPNNNFTIKPTSTTKLNDVWNLNKILTFGTIPSGYHLATTSELKSGQTQPTITWGSTKSPVKIYVKKTTSPTPNPTPNPADRKSVV